MSGTGTVARDCTTQQSHYLRKRILGTAGNATYDIGIIPPGANILRITTLVRTVFSGGVPTLSAGPSGTPAGWVAALGTLVTALGRNVGILIATGTLGVDVATVVTATVAGTPTAGVADVEVEFTINNDQ